VRDEILSAGDMRITAFWMWRRRAV